TADDDPKRARMVRVGGDERTAIRRELREVGEHYARDSRVVERVRLVADEREPDEGRVCASLRQIDREIREPHPARWVVLRLESDDVYTARLGIGQACACLLERDRRVRGYAVGKVRDRRRVSQGAGLPDRIHA